MQKTVFVNDPELAARFLIGQSLLAHGGAQEVSDANTC